MYLKDEGVVSLPKMKMSSLYPKDEGVVSVP